jgi:hypothetical protein
MANPAGEAAGKALRLDFGRLSTLQFRGSVVTSAAGLFADLEFDDALGRTATAAESETDGRTGKKGRQALVGMLRQAVFGPLAGYEDVNDAARLRHDPAMRWIVSGEVAFRCAALESQMGRAMACRRKEPLGAHRSTFAEERESLWLQLSRNQNG